MKELSDPTLLMMIKQDDQQAFACLMYRYSGILLQHILRRIHSEMAAQDILQEVFISLWNRRMKIQVNQSIYPYLFQAVKYEVIDWVVKSSNQIRYEQELLKEELSVYFPAEDVLVAKELEEILQKEVAKMPTTMKSIFKLSREELLSTKEIAEQLSLSEQTVKNNISIALKRLRNRLRYEHYLLWLSMLLAKFL